MMTTSVSIYEPEQHNIVVAKNAAIMELRDNMFKEGVHYGEPFKGAGKPTLLKPGAETIMSRFMLWPEFIERSKVETWDVDAPVFHYRYECRLIHRETGQVWGAGIGSCNSLEDKYRWRKLERTCPKCGAANIRKSKQGTGWYCWAKTDGCGANFNAGDPAIEDQEVGRAPNDEVFTIVNTIDKMAQKRAFVAAVLVATGASAYFTQDVEDFPGYAGEIITGEVVEIEPPTPARQKPDNKPPKASVAAVSTPPRDEAPNNGSELFDYSKWDAARAYLIEQGYADNDFHAYGRLLKIAGIPDDEEKPWTLIKAKKFTKTELVEMFKQRAEEKQAEEAAKAS